MAKVTVYSTPTCPWCDRAKEWLKQNKIKFNEIDVSSDIKKAEEMVKKTGQMGVPVIDVDGQFVVGFDVTKLKNLLKV